MVIRNVPVWKSSCGGNTSQEILANSGQDWRVSLDNISVQSREVPGYKAVVRSDTCQVLGVVSMKYSPIQNQTWFQFMDEWLKEGVVYETAGCYDGGKAVWVAARMPQSLVIAGDEYRQYLVATNRHDGKGSGKIFATDVRLVCGNSLGRASRKGSRVWSTRHMGDANSRVVQAYHHLQAGQKYFQEFKEEAEGLLELPFNNYPELVKFLLPDGRNVENRRSMLYGAIAEPDLENIKGTVWGTLQAVADFVAHEEPRRRTATWQENRFKQVIIQGSKMIRDAEKFMLGVN